MLMKRRLKHLRRLNLFNAGWKKKISEVGLQFFQEEWGSLHRQVIRAVSFLMGKNTPVVRHVPIISARGHTCETYTKWAIPACLPACLAPLTLATAKCFETVFSAKQITMASSEKLLSWLGTLDIYRRTVILQRTISSLMWNKLQYGVDSASPGTGPDNLICCFVGFLPLSLASSNVQTWAKVSTENKSETPLWSFGPLLWHVVHW